MTAQKAMRCSTPTQARAQGAQRGNCGACAMYILLMAHNTAAAGFIDERANRAAAGAPTATAKPGNVRAPGFQLEGESAGWSELVSLPAGPQSIGSAISRIVPQGHRPAVIDADDNVVDMRASFPNGQTRRQAMEHLAQTLGLTIDMRDKAVRVALVPAKPSPTPAPSQTKAPLPTPVAVPATPAAAEVPTHTKAAKGDAAQADGAVAGDSAAPHKGQALRPAPTFAATPADGNLRRLLRRWAEDAGWTFGDEHWTLGADIPLVASLSMGTDFKQAVRTALDATEFTSVPGRPCFYSNNVLRVVPRQEQCNRTSP